MYLNSKDIDEKPYIKYTLDELGSIVSHYLVFDCLFLLSIMVKIRHGMFRYYFH